MLALLRCPSENKDPNVDTSRNLAFSPKKFWKPAMILRPLRPRRRVSTVKKRILTAAIMLTVN